METVLSYEAEEYVEAIYRLQKRSGVANTNELTAEVHAFTSTTLLTLAFLFNALARVKSRIL